MKSPRLLARFTAAIVAFSPALALAHPGHDGDHGIEWDFGHLASHPFATISCVLVLGAIGWVAWRLLRTPSPSRQKIR